MLKTISRFNPAAKDKTRQVIFGVSLDELSLQLEDHPHLEIPIFLAHIIVYLDKEGHVPGVFSLQADTDKVEKLKKRIETDPHTQDFINPHVAASVILSFLQALPEPILLAKNYQALMDAAKNRDLSMLQRIFSDMPRRHYLVLRALLVLLHRLTRRDATGNLSREIAYSTTPYLLKPPSIEQMINDTELYGILGFILIEECGVVLVPPADVKAIHPNEQLVTRSSDPIPDTSFLNDLFFISRRKRSNSDVFPSDGDQQKPGGSRGRHRWSMPSANAKLSFAQMQAMENIPTSMHTTPTATPTPSILDIEDEQPASNKLFASSRKIFLPPPKVEYLVKFPSNTRSPSMKDNRSTTPYQMFTLNPHKSSPPVLPEQPHLQLDAKETDDGGPSFFGNLAPREPPIEGGSVSLSRVSSMIGAPLQHTPGISGMPTLDSKHHKAKAADVAKRFAASVENMRRVDERFGEVVDNMEERRSLFLSQLERIREGFDNRRVLLSPEPLESLLPDLTLNDNEIFVQEDFEHMSDDEPQPKENMAIDAHKEADILGASKVVDEIQQTNTKRITPTKSSHATTTELYNKIKALYEELHVIKSACRNAQEDAAIAKLYQLELLESNAVKDTRIRELEEECNELRKYKKMYIEQTHLPVDSTYGNGDGSDDGLYANTNTYFDTTEQSIPPMPRPLQTTDLDVNSLRVFPTYTPPQLLKTASLPTMLSPTPFNSTYTINQPRTHLAHSPIRTELFAMPAPPTRKAPVPPMYKYQTTTSHV